MLRYIPGTNTVLYGGYPSARKKKKKAAWEKEMCVRMPSSMMTHLKIILNDFSAKRLHVFSSARILLLAGHVLHVA